MNATAHSPEDCHRLFVTYAQARDLDGLVSLFDDNALLVVPSASLDVAAAKAAPEVRGKESLRDNLNTFLSRNPTFVIDDTKVHQTGDIALVSSVWRVEGERPGGAKLQMAHINSSVMRRQPDGSWCIVINWTAVDERGSCA
ncbi:YybH family protein [Sorangium atrum]|uniref:DUF4440 domain-containing protein n=1 Tax=Sorangium atrum TaxID=2995308 RepID=A0ABT5CF82_9BACT|nr:DUF4440 domain-containing protein [Sorangium aterium]MDC0685081.1 DUF4440 domain-containing protein [Sorangium aterium]